MNLDQQRKLLIQTLNYRYKDPTLNEKERKKFVADLKKLVETQLPGSKIELPKE